MYITLVLYADFMLCKVVILTMMTVKNTVCWAVTRHCMVDTWLNRTFFCTSEVFTNKSSDAESFWRQSTRWQDRLKVVYKYVNNVVWVTVYTTLTNIGVFIVFSLDSYMFRHVHQPSSGFLPRRKESYTYYVHYVIHYNYIRHYLYEISYIGSGFLYGIYVHLCV